MPESWTPVTPAPPSTQPSKPFVAASSLSGSPLGQHTIPLVRRSAPRPAAFDRPLAQLIHDLEVEASRLRHSATRLATLRARVASDLAAQDTTGLDAKFQRQHPHPGRGLGGPRCTGCRGPGTGASTACCISWPLSSCATTHPAAPTTGAGAPKARPRWRPCATSTATVRCGRPADDPQRESGREDESGRANGGDSAIQRG